MWKENILVTSEERTVLYAGEHTLQYFDLQQEFPFAYPKGKLEEGDLFLYFSPDICAVEKEIQALEARGFWSWKGLDKEERTGTLALAASIGNEDIQPIAKRSREPLAEDSVFLDTIYERNEIFIRRKTGKLEVYLNGQTLSWDFDRLKSAAVLVKERSVKMFWHSETAEDENLERFIRSGVYPSFCDRAQLQKKTIDMVLNRNVYDCICRLEAGTGEDFFAYGGRGAVIRKEKLDIGTDSQVVYLFEDEETLMKKLEKNSWEYKKISTGDVKGLPQQHQFKSFRLLGNEEKTVEVSRLLQKSSVTNTTILLTGESGTGKTFLAREIHKNSKRKQEAFVHVNCAAIPYQLIESELFGYEEGAFTGALKGGKKGYFELAQGGTLFLDEITEIPITLQGKLLEVLQNKTFYRVGGTKKYEVDVRLIAATNRDLKQLVREKRFREDLYYRINVFPVEIPPLRNRVDSMYSIVMDILPDICSRLEMEPVLLSHQAYGKIVQYPWPGNIRELENVLEKAVILCDGKIILAEDIILAETGGFTAAAVTLQEVREQAEKQAIESALQMFHGDKNKAARFLDIGRSNMFEKVKKYHIQLNEVDEDDFR